MTLLEWINTHDCGVHPTAIQTPLGIVVRVLEVHPDGSTSTYEALVNNMTQAYEALGY